MIWLAIQMVKSEKLNINGVWSNITKGYKTYSASAKEVTCLRIYSDDAT